MPRYHPDSEDSEDYDRARRHRSNSRSQTPGPLPRHNNDNNNRPRDYSPSAYQDAGPPYATPAVKHTHFEQHTPFYPPDTTSRSPQPNHYNTLQVPPTSRRMSGSGSRSTSDMPTDTMTTTTSTRKTRTSRSGGARSRRSDDGSSSSSDSDDSHDGNRGPVRKAKTALENTFSPSTAGLGVGVLGAIVGGLVAGEAAHAAAKRSRSKSRSGHHRDDDHYDREGREKREKSAVLLSTIVGAAVGGLGANAVERRIERSKGREEEWNGAKDKRKELEGRVREREREVYGDDYGREHHYRRDDRDLESGSRRY